jgi:superfamily II DNA/RNA helicase
MLERLDAAAGAVQAVIIVPSRELAKQISEVWRPMNAAYRMVALYGGRPMHEELALLQNSSPCVVVGTPGRLIDHLTKGAFSTELCKLLVIDEFDKCLEMGFCDEMQQLLGLLPDAVSRFLLSATDCDEIPEFAGAEDIKRLDFRGSDDNPTGRMSFYKVTTVHEERLQALYNLLCAVADEPAIVFCNFRETVDEVQSHLKKAGLHSIGYHGAMEQKERELSLYRFTAGCSNILVSTDLAARGLDIKDVRHIVHYQRALSAEIFTHRNGRTARWEAGGNVYLIAFENKELPDFVPDGLEEFPLPRRMVLPPAPEWTVLYVGKGKRDKISRGDLAGFFMKIGGLRPDEVGTITVFDNFSYVAVKLNRMRAVLKAVEGKKIKGIKTLVQPLRGR